MNVDAQGRSEFLSLNAERRADLFYHAFQDAPDGLIIVSPNGTILYANTQTEALFGYRAEELMDRPVEMLLPADTRERHIADREGYVAHSPSNRTMGRGVPLFGRRKNGSEFPAEIALSPIDYNGDVFVIAAVRNTSEWVRLHTLESRIYKPLARVIGLRHAKQEIDRAVDEALEDLISDLTPHASEATSRPSKATERVQGKKEEERAA
jgi:PAS domain S-box-containing protein